MLRSPVQCDVSYTFSPIMNISGGNYKNGSNILHEETSTKCSIGVKFEIIILVPTRQINIIVIYST